MKIEAVRAVDEPFRVKNTGPSDFYSRAFVDIDGREARAFHYGLHDVIPGLGSHEATLVDTNLPSKRRVNDESFDITEMSWHFVMPKGEGAAQEAARLLDQTVWEFHLGGDKPFFQSLLLATAIRLNTCGARSMPVPIDGLITGKYIVKLLESEHADQFYMCLKPPKLKLPFEVVFRLGCKRYRGTC